MARIWDKAKDKDVSVNVIYKKAADGKFYLNFDGTTYSNEIAIAKGSLSSDDWAVAYAKLLDLFLHGLVVVDSGVYHAALSVDASNGLLYVDQDTQPAASGTG